MTGSLTLDVSILVAAQLVILLIPWVVLHIVYIGDIDPMAYGEQATTFTRARLYLGMPLTIALCWFGPRLLDTRQDIAIVLYIVVICWLVIATARFMAAFAGGLSWIFPMLVGPAAAWAAAVIVARNLAADDPSVATWIFGGIGALFGPPAFVAMGGWLAGRGLASFN